MRKEAGLDIADRIELGYVAEGEVAAAFERFAEMIRQETLAVVLAPDGVAGAAAIQTADVGDAKVVLSLRKA
jgi:isoleucyl-tRNA synthetase